MNTTKTQESIDYKIFTSPDGDWYVVGKDAEPKPIILYEGDAREKAYESILKDMGIIAACEDRAMPHGSYIPLKKDFK
jgi:hypothetical protein